MATTVDELLVKVSADMGQLKRELATTQRKTSEATTKMSRSFNKVNTAVDKAKTAIGALAGVVAGLATIGAAGRVSAEFQDLQMTLNTVFKTAESGQAAMDFIIQFAQRTPFDIQTLTKAFIQLGGAGIKPTVDMLTVMGDAASATVDKMGTFEALTKLVTRSVGGGLGLEELEQIADRGVPVYQILQKEIGLTRGEISEFGQTAEGAKQITDALFDGLEREFGGGMDRAAKNLSTSVSNLGIAGTQLTKVFGDSMSPVLRELADETAEFLGRLEPLAHFLGSMLAGVISILMLALKALNTVLAALGTTIDWLRNRIADLLGEYGEWIRVMPEEELESLQEVMNKHIEGVDNAGKASKEYTKQLDKMGEEIAATEAQLSGLSAEFVKAAQAAGIDLSNFKANGDIEGPRSGFITRSDNKEVNEFYQKYVKLEQAKKKLAQIDLARSLLGEKGEAEEIQDQIKALHVYMSQFGDATGMTKEKIAELQKELNMQKPLMSSMVSIFQSAGQQIGDAIADAMTTGANALESFKDIARNIVGQIISQLMQLAIINPIINSVMGAFGAPSSTNLPTLGSAGGGAMHANSPRLVGERGPELFVPHSAGTLMNNANTKNALGGQTVTVNQSLNFSLGVSDTVKAEIAGLMPIINQSAVSAVQQARSRGGSFASSFGG